MECKRTVTVEYPDGPEGDAAIRRALSAHDAYAALWDIAQEVFRPVRKHGYPDQELQQTLDKAGDAGTELIHLLEKRFYEILEEHRVSMEDWQ